MYEVEHLKSGLSISTHFGCPLNCDYCVLHSLTDFAGSPIMIAQPQDLINRLKQPETLFLEGQTPLIINNRTDPFLPDVVPYTKDLLELLCALETKSPIVLITKLLPNTRFDELSKKLNLIVIYSYSSLESDCNYGHIHEIEKLRSFFPNSFLFHYYRPIIPRKNDDINSIINTLDMFRTANYNGTIIAGLRITEANKDLVNFVDCSFVGSNHKLLSEDTFLSIRSELAKRGYNYDVFRHTSCAIDSSLRRKNRLNYFGKNGHCSKNCSNYGICRESKTIDLVTMMEAFQNRIGRRLEYQIVEEAVEVNGVLNQEEVAFFRNAYGVVIHASKMTNSPSEEGILHG